MAWRRAFYGQLIMPNGLYVCKSTSVLDENYYGYSDFYEKHLVSFNHLQRSCCFFFGLKNEEEINIELLRSRLLELFRIF